MQVFPYLAVAVFGLCVGSFLAAFTYRRQKGLDVFKGRSFCPHCRAKIRWFDNFPLLSFIRLKGKCRSCGKKISWRYPLIEFSTAIIFLVYYHFLSSCGELFSTSVLCSWKTELGWFSYLFFGITIYFLVSIFVIDLENKIIPDGLVFWGILFVFVFLVLSAPSLIFQRFLVGFLTALFFLFIHLLTRGRGMGLGDVKFVVLGGVILAWPQTAVWLFLAFLSGAIIGLTLVLFKKAKFGKEIPFGPYLAASLLVTIIFGERFLSLL